MGEESLMSVDSNCIGPVAVGATRPESQGVEDSTFFKTLIALQHGLFAL